MPNNLAFFRIALRSALVALAALATSPAQASLFAGEALDKVAVVMAIVVLFIVPVVAMLRMRAERLVQGINLHLALGGSFETVPAPAARVGHATRAAR